MSYGMRMMGAVLAAILIGGPISKAIGAENPVFVGVVVGGIAYALLGFGSIVFSRSETNSSGSKTKSTWPGGAFFTYLKIFFGGATQKELKRADIDTNSVLFRLLFKTAENSNVGTSSDGFSGSPAGSFNDLVLDGDIESVKSVLRESPEKLDEIHDGSWTVLFTAAFIGNKEMAEVLLDAGANIEAVNHENYTPIIYAAMLGNAETVKLLIGRGANVNAVNIFGMTPLGAAALGKVGRELIVESAPDAIFNFNEPESYLTVVKSLLDNGAEVNPNVDDGRTPLFTACEAGNTEIVRLLLSAGAKVNTTDSDGTTPVMVAKSTGYSDIVDLLESETNSHECIDSNSIQEDAIDEKAVLNNTSQPRKLSAVNNETLADRATVGTDNALLSKYKLEEEIKRARESGKRAVGISSIVILGTIMFAPLAIIVYLFALPYLGFGLFNLFRANSAEKLLRSHKSFQES